jgi:hypothetical protein
MVTATVTPPLVTLINGKTTLSVKTITAPTPTRVLTKYTMAYALTTRAYTFTYVLYPLTPPRFTLKSKLTAAQRHHYIQSDPIRKHNRLQEQRWHVGSLDWSWLDRLNSLIFERGLMGSFFLLHLNVFISGIEGYRWYGDTASEFFWKSREGGR